MDYRLVFDVTQEAPPLGWPAVGLLFVVIGILLWLYGDNMGSWWHGPFRSSPAWRKAFAGVFLGFSIFWTSVVSIHVLGGYFGAIRAMRNGEATVVESEVQDFHPMPFGGHDTERFVVGGVLFAYSDDSSSSGFNQTTLNGGPIREGLKVRIHYIRRGGVPQILKLEIKK